MTVDTLFLLLLLPFLLYSAWTDLRFMRLFNATNIACAALFLVLAPWILPLGEVALRFGAGFAVGVVLILAAVAGVFGAGDAKYLAALTPWIAPEDYATFCMMLSGTLLMGLLVLLVARRSPALRAATPDWRAWRKRKIPMGVPISAAMLLLLTDRALPGVWPG